MDRGWRCAFLISIALLGVGLFIRLTLVETPEFARIRASYQVSRLPLLDVVRDDWRHVLLGWLARMGEGAVFTIYSLYMLSYLTSIVHLSRTLVLGAVTTAGLVLIVTTPLAAAWSDRVERRRLFALSALVHGPAAFPLMWMLSSGSAMLAAIAIVLAVGVLWAGSTAPRRRCCESCSPHPCVILAYRSSTRWARSSSSRRCRCWQPCWWPGTATSRGTSGAMSHLAARSVRARRV
jgi:predicted MFS family arabinose efflux permease